MSVGTSQSGAWVSITPLSFPAHSYDCSTLQACSPRKVKTNPAAPPSSSSSKRRGTPPRPESVRRTPRRPRPWEPSSDSRRPSSPRFAGRTSPRQSRWRVVAVPPSIRLCVMDRYVSVSLSRCTSPCMFSRSSIKSRSSTAATASSSSPSAHPPPFLPHVRSIRPRGTSPAST